jgi:hypothetical protein
VRNEKEMFDLYNTSKNRGREAKETEATVEQKKDEGELSADEKHTSSDEEFDIEQLIKEQKESVEQTDTKPD